MHETTRGGGVKKSVRSIRCESPSVEANSKLSLSLYSNLASCACARLRYTTLKRHAERSCGCGARDNYLISWTWSNAIYCNIRYYSQHKPTQKYRGGHPTSHNTHDTRMRTHAERGEERRSSHTQTRTNTPWHNPPHTHTAQARRVQSPNPPPIRYAPPSGLGAPAMVGPTKYLPAENIRCTDPTGAPAAGLAVRPVMQRSSHENPTCHVVG